MKTVSFDQFCPKQVRIYISDRSVDFSCSIDRQCDDFDERQKKNLLLKGHFKQGQIDNIVSVRQVHGGRIIKVPFAESRNRPNTEEADGLITNVPSYPLSIRVADCLPVFFYDDSSQSIAIVHAGWRGTRQKAVILALEKMSREFNSEPKNIKVFLGPCLRPCCYLVGQEFLTYFPDNVIMREGQYYFDLAAANKGQLIQNGVLEKNISDCNQCTSCRSDYFSYRREGKEAGRMICLIMVEPRR